jgi:hypothetical protein
MLWLGCRGSVEDETATSGGGSAASPVSSAGGAQCGGPTGEGCSVDDDCLIDSACAYGTCEAGQCVINEGSGVTSCLYQDGGEQKVGMCADCACAPKS